jgi:hypothetical protein
MSAMSVVLLLLAHEPSAGAAANVPAVLSTPAPTTTPTTAQPATSDRLPAGNYLLSLDLHLKTAIPVVGAAHARARTLSTLVIDDDGMATQKNCWVDTTGPGYRVEATRRALAAMPVQRYRLVVDGERVSADPGPLRFGDEDDDHDGDVGVAMDLVIDALGRFTVQVQSDGRSRLVGARTPTGAAGTVEVLYSKQKIVSGLPIVVDGQADVESARFTIDRAAKAGCP